MRRSEFIRVISGGVLLLAGVPAAKAAGRAIARTKLRFGVVTDTHYADREPNGTRHYRDSMQKMQRAVEYFNSENVDFIIELGDMKDTTHDAAVEPTLRFLEEIERIFQSFNGPAYHVLGNHDMDCISKEEFLSHTFNAGRAKGRSYYSFTARRTRCIVLDANFNPDGEPYSRGNFDWKKCMIPTEQLRWLEKELSAHPTQPTLIFLHQLLDSFSDVRRSVCVSNAEEVVAILERHPQVRAVFQGHHHPGHYSHRAGIHYLTLQGMIEKATPANSYAVVELRENGDIYVKGFGACPDREMRRK